MSHMELHERCVDILCRLGAGEQIGRELTVLVRDLKEALSVPPPDGLPSSLDRVIAGAIKSCIDVHGPITVQFTSSAAKRVRKSINGTWKIERRRRDGKGK